jgi:hypothetical protein
MTLTDADGMPLRRTPDGDLVPDTDALDRLPDHPPGARCADHPTEPAARCRCCWSEALAGDRPRALIGRRMENP